MSMIGISVKALCGPFTEASVAAATSRLLPPGIREPCLHYRISIVYVQYRLWLSDAAAAIDLEGDAGDELGVVGGEVERGIGDIARRREAAERNRGLEPGAVLRRIGAHEGAEQRRLAGDRAERVDADIVGSELDRH